MAIEVVVATAIVIATVATTPLRPDIALQWPGLPAGQAIVVGMAFWLVFGLFGGLRARLRPGGVVRTFGTPFMVAGAILGGPLAGAAMGVVSELELREIRTQPWYGVLANHAVSVMAAVGAALVGPPLRAILDGFLPDQPALTFFGMAMGMAFTYEGVNLALLIPTIALKHEMSIEEAVRTQEFTLRAPVFGEALLAWTMAAGYLSFGWWAPIAYVGLVLLVWQAHDRSEALRRDAKTGLLNDAGFRPLVDAALAAARAGHRRSAVVLLDLDNFKDVNDTYLYDAGDEVLITVAKRILESVRATDAVARLNRAGDEFAVLFDRVPDLGTARALADRLQRRITEPIRLRTVEAVVAVGASIGVVHIGIGMAITYEEVMSLADARMLVGKRYGSGIVTEGENDAVALARRIAASPRRARARPRRTGRSSRPKGPKVPPH